MILYPTETIYALGVHALDELAQQRLFAMKGRDEGKLVSWLVRNIEDIAHYGELSITAERLVERFLPGALTLVLAPKATVPEYRRVTNEVSFRISPDPFAQALIAEFMAEYGAPLTCTSANRSGMPPLPTVPEILAQLGATPTAFDRIIDDGPRSGTASTVVKVVGEEITILRTGAITPEQIFAAQAP